MSESKKVDNLDGEVSAIVQPIFERLSERLQKNRERDEGIMVSRVESMIERALSKKEAEDAHRKALNTNQWIRGASLTLIGGSLGAMIVALVLGIAGD